jgi:3-oxoacyl-[acyl-carrier-protein] synthase II
MLEEANIQQQRRRQGSDSVSNRPRVVITGMGAITPVGNTVSETWEALIAGRSGAGPMTLLDSTGYDCQIAAELKDFDPHRFIPRKKARKMPTAAQLTVVVSGQAIEDARIELEAADRDRFGIILGTAGTSTMEETERATKYLLTGAKRYSPVQSMKVWPNMSAYSVCLTHGLRGYNATLCTACASGSQAVAAAARVLERFDADVMLAGGSEHAVSETGLAGFIAMGALATSYNDDPARAMRPFDADREGFIPAFGCVMFILERLDDARARGARIYAEVLGSGISNDAFHLIAPDPNGAGASLAIRRALKDAGVDASDVDYINAHAASTPLGDVAETKAIKSVFGERAYDIPVSSTKSMVGHMMGAAGALEAAACIMTLNEGIIHPTINYETPDPDCDLDYVPNVAREAQVDIILSNSFGAGGQNACLILGRMDA